MYDINYLLYICTMRRWSPKQLANIERDVYQPLGYTKIGEVEEDSLLVDRAILEYSLANGKQKQLQTYLKLRTKTYKNAGLIFQKHLQCRKLREHLAWLLKQGWVRKLRRGVYQIVGARHIAKKLGTYRTAALISPSQIQGDPLALCYGAWIACFARTWKNNCNVAIADGLKRTHFVIASTGYLSKKLGVSARTISLWKERAWTYYWQKETIRFAMPKMDWTAGMIAGEDLVAMKTRGHLKVALGPNMYFDFTIGATVRKHGNI